MSIGRQFKAGFSMILRQMGGTMVIIKNWGMPEESRFEVKGLKILRKTDRMM